MSILITGGAGFFGRALVSHLLDHGTYDRICIYSRDEAKHALMRDQFQDDRLRFFVGDVRDVWRLTRAMEAVRLVVHAAALKRVEVCEYDPGEVAKTNVMGSLNVIEAATMAGVEKVVALSTDKACDPVNAYGASKLLAEKMFLAANNSRGKTGPIFAVTRYGNVAGSTGSVIPRWRSMLAKGHKTLPVTNPEATRFWMTATEAVDLVLDTAATMRGGELAIPDLPAYRLGDLCQAMGGVEQVTGMGALEKMHESMRTGETSEHARRMSIKELRAGLKLV